MYAYVHECMHIYVRLYIHTHVSFTKIYKRESMYTHICAYIPRMYIYMYMYILTCSRFFTQSRVENGVYTYVYMLHMCV